MKAKLFYLLVLFITSLGLKGQTVTFSDSNFKAKLLSASSGNTIAKDLNSNYFKIDANGDGEIQISEALQVSELNISFYGGNFSGTTISSINGIKSFSALKTFQLQIGNTSYYSGAVDVSNMSSLENVNLSIDFKGSSNHDINLQNCSALKTLDAGFIYASPGISFTGCTALTDIKLKGYHDLYGTAPVSLSNLNFGTITTLKSLYIENININTLSLQGCNALEELTLKEYFNNTVSNPLNLANLPGLKKLILNKYNITLDAHSCPNLTSITGGNITDLNVQDCANLVDLKVASFNNTMNVKNCTQLKTIFGIANCSTIDLSTSNLQSLDSITFLPIDCYQQQSTLLSSLNVQNCPNLRKISTYELKLTALDVSNLPKLESLQVLQCGSNRITSINASNCPLLNTFDIKGLYKVQSINLQNCSSLPTIILHDGNAYEGKYAISNINLTGCDQFNNLDIRNCSFTSLDLPTLPLLKKLDCSNNFLTDLNLMNLQSLESVVCGKNKLTTLAVNNLPNLVSFDYSDGYLASANFQNLPKLKNLSFSNNKLTSMVLNNLPLIEKLQCNNNLLTNLDLQNLPGIKNLDCSKNQLVTLVVDNLTGLEALTCSNNQLSSLNLTGNPSLGYLDCSYNNLTSLDATNLKVLPATTTYNVGILNCSHNQLQSLNIAGIHMSSIDFSYNNLSAVNLDNTSFDFYFDCSNNQLTTLDLSKYYYSDYAPTLETFNCSNNALTTMFLKNGINEFGSSPDFSNNPNLKYICSDDAELTKVQSLVSQYGYSNCSVSSYCSFTPGGAYNTITGTVRFDGNNNGCDPNDDVFENMKLKIDDGTTTGETFVKRDGTYSFFTQSGDFTVTAEPENPSLFTVNPASFTINSTAVNNTTSTQDLCVSKNANGKDLEIVVAPVTDARPGFDAVYKLMWRNKGNTTLSGTAVLNFDSTKMTFVSSSLPPTVSGSQIKFNVTNLKPYANTSSEITFRINAPTDASSPVNIGDVLNFTADISPISGDINPDDNNFSYKQTVVGSYDPNDIICLEGKNIPLPMVGKYLHYMVNFENTGTASATNIVVEMDINPDDYEVASLQLQNTSHLSYTKMTGNKAEFIMKDINLQAGAHGNLLLKIKSKNNLVLGDRVINKANIYFDYNYPVITNEAITTIGENGTLSTSDNINNRSTATIFPNPTKGDVNINTDSKILSVEIYDGQGRIIQKHAGINSLSTKIAIRSTISGIYIFKIITEKETLIKKVIKN
ncbi:hypothetical protein C1637_04875 [Chryseobacterium lactis]|uniref:T9SS C-terminal target domain-containing protein n=1 Tax=Chryseobacterium lactis TaxID=1241981 RepID=A0A3G6RYK5_CHRLC|nr:T9SS type A sorting domain-containing protein [Chryseobacterium lactis]AZA81908.1 T9SS C-terminal target domain-containing protein [Chryseobacterium lactis]AZB06906.1 T9SS C-terminal target domain-containing protein [Chryseobacterium lactis]PNW15758.1 hypothetical protein C1637_04875 [Chryseobacterium lactis]